VRIHGGSLRRLSHGIGMEERGQIDVRTSGTEIAARSPGVTCQIADVWTLSLCVRMCTLPHTAWKIVCHREQKFPEQLFGIRVNIRP
jgi:hypothetical protein